MTPLPASQIARSDSSLSLRTRRSMIELSTTNANGTLQDPLDVDHSEGDHLLPKNDVNVRMDWDYDEDGYSDDMDLKKHGHHNQSELPLWRFIAIAVGIGLSFFVFKMLAVTLGHSDKDMNMRPAERLYYNGSTYFRPTVILISLDGFRNDYLERNVTPNLLQFASQGIRAEYMQPSFPSITFPNHWTLATGLYPESHGIVANDFYDPELKEMFIHKKPAISMQPKWWGGEPVSTDMIWATCRNQERHSAVIMWPGSAVPSFEPSYMEDYVKGTTVQEKMDTTLAWLDMPFDTRPQMIAVYVPQVDQKGHGGGPEGKQLNAVLENVDQGIGHLLAGLEARNLDSHVHVVIVSDHGMAQTSKERYIYYDDIISPETLALMEPREAWPLLGLRPKPNAPADAAERVYNELYTYTQNSPDPHFEVYLRGNIPERYHYSATERIAPVVALPDVGYAFVRHHPQNENPPKGVHGYDNFSPEMYAIFMARGPRLNHRYKPGTIVEPFVNVEVYGFVADLLNLNPAPNNGTLNGKFRVADKQ